MGAVGRGDGGQAGHGALLGVGPLRKMRQAARRGGLGVCVR
ncbi:hypothetical protein UO65_1889 [Actinokineospora spheciospongiae]|uniref:Uncharacterized protein n=1 Tax=Actinokineospora spheciospongiae TaxID=909613 RepID=W7J166_9PSEU|nr:hypothetical protein UO65_1889 [Actinokineospora spheciospongiae]